MQANSFRGGNGAKPKTKPEEKPRTNSPNISTSASRSPAKKSSASTPNRKPSTPKSSSVDAVADQFGGLSLRSQEARPGSTGLIYDEIMLRHFCVWDENYPECPARIKLPYEKCVENGLVQRCKRLPAVSCDDKMLCTKHDEEYMTSIKKTVEMSREELLSMEHCFDGVVFHENTYASAKMSAGSTISLVESIVKNTVANGIALVRPPGHHAMKAEACGYCFFNNVALAAQHSLDKLGVQKILIIDWDVHHGQGTQQMFYDDPRVMYISTHRYEHGWFWPHLKESNFDYIGNGRGKGFNINIPLNKTGMTDSDYLAIFHQLIMPLAFEFDPDLVLISAGYDCALGCPEFCPDLVIISAGYDCCIGDEKGDMEVTPPLFSHLIHKLKSLANGKLAVILEGGYCLQSLSESVVYTVRGLLDDCCPRLQPSQPPQPELVQVLLNSVNVLRPYWKCLQYQTLDYPNKAVNLISSDPRGEAEFCTEKNKPAYYELDSDYPTHTDEVKSQYSQLISDIVKKHPIRSTKRRTCYVYDEAMKKHKSVMDPQHPEKPERISRIHSMLEEYGITARCQKLPSRRATDQELNLVHSMKYIKSVRAYETTKPREYAELELQYNSIYLHKETYSSAATAAGSLLNVVDSVMKNESRNGFAVIRPPGHHAEKHTACGFCFFNSVPVAARYAQQKHGAKKVVIIDWDVHHGNGTQHMFEDDPSVLYISLHRYDDGGFFPGSEEANYDNVGQGSGTGYNVNIPFNRKVNSEGKISRPCGDPEYIAAFQQIVMPICYEFAPDLVLVSAGFDAAKGDPLGGYRITPGGYAHMTHMLSSLADDKLILALEGGYNLNSISESFSSCAHVMLGGLPPRLPSVEVDWSAKTTIQNVISTHKQYWKSLCCDAILPYTDDEIEKLENPDDEDGEESDEKILKSLTDRLEKTSIKDNNSEPATPSNSSKPIQKSEEQGACGGSTNPEESPPQMFAVVPLKWCAHVEDITPLGNRQLDVQAPCEVCSASGENWICLTCYKILCSRFVNEHMLYHAIETEHRMVLSYADLSVWCYACDSYVHCEELLPYKNAAHLNKFGKEIY